MGHAATRVVTACRKVVLMQNPLIRVLEKRAIDAAEPGNASPHGVPAVDESATNRYYLR